ncbi:BrnA antitoxin family protein [Microvirga rosea]|uniref:BrnA antitoxin family protein n=1 Tax=Microvirga rosea TaxID=2715425 RepID=UPI001D0B899E|nr:BrnA antitoxin family protein [Microvirga rosea]MCB8819296.1 BrnA antitoxin family protein [Microvirga rosea]
MFKPPNRTRTTNDPRQAAEAAFKKATTKIAEPVPKKPIVPGAKEMVTLRIDRDILDHFQEAGPGWQDRINEALRKAVGQ